MLIAENTKFRVYGGILARGSNIFKDMFDVAQPQESDMVDGCPGVRLDDPAELVADFLEMMLNGMVVTKHADYPTWRQTKACLVMGHKYEIDDFYEEGLAQINSWFPNTIGEWDSESAKWADGEQQYFDWIDMANTFRKFELRSLHVKVLYWCATIPEKYIINGCPCSHDSDDYKDVDIPDDDRGDGNPRMDLPKIKLHPNDILTCFASRQPLSEANIHWILSFSGQSPPDKNESYHAWPKCKQGAQSFREDIFTNEFGMVTSEALSGFSDGYVSKFGMCSKCVAFYNHLIASERQKVLDRLEQLINVVY